MNKEELRKFVGNRIKEARQTRNKSLKEVGEAINYDFSSLSKIERGEYEASYLVLKQISDFLEVPVGFFYGDEIPIPKELEGLGIDGIFLDKNIRENEELTEDEIEQIKHFIQFTFNQKEKS